MRLQKGRDLKTLKTLSYGVHNLYDILNKF